MKNMIDSTILEHTLIAMPAYNEEKVIRSVIRSIKKLGFKNILVVNDASTDRTKDIVLNEDVTLINHRRNLGVGGATRTAILYAKRKGYQYLVLMDSDGQHNPKDINNLFFYVNSYDVVIGSRFLKKNKIPFKRKIYNRIASFIVFILYGIMFTDTQTGFKMLNRKAIEKIKLRSNGYEFCTEFIAEIKKYSLKYKEVPISVKYFPYSHDKDKNFFQGMIIFFKLLFEYR